MAHLTAFQLEQRTKLISLETYENMLSSGKLETTQGTPKNLISTYGIRFDEEKGGVFLWSGLMQRYYLIAKRK